MLRNYLASNTGRFDQVMREVQVLEALVEACDMRELADQGRLIIQARNVSDITAAYYSYLKTLS